MRVDTLRHVCDRDASCVLYDRNILHTLPRKEEKNWANMGFICIL